ncbi:MAG: GNAT family N-acetyltransferase [Hyphomonadaceae bacterium]
MEHAPERYAAWLARPAARLWLAEAAETGAPIGYVVLDEATSPLPDPRGDDLEIHRLYVLSRWQGRGLGAALMETALAAAAAAGAGRMRIGVRALNAPAIAFYKRMGFTVAGTRKHHIGRLEQDDLVLTRLLAPQG